MNPVAVQCGSRTSENCTYLVQPATTSTPSVDPCTYTICKCSPNVCRIRFDFNASPVKWHSVFHILLRVWIWFQTFQIAGPAVGTTTAVATGATRRIGGRIGDCLSDTFSITSPGNSGSPVICGFNTGQHSVLYIFSHGSKESLIFCFSDNGCLWSLQCGIFWHWFWIIH